MKSNEKNKKSSRWSSLKENKKFVYGVIAFICIALVAVIIIVALNSSKKEGEAVAMEYKDPNENITATVDRNYMSLMVAIINGEYGMDAITDMTVWDQPISSAGKTYRDVIRVLATENTRTLLQAEYLNDYVYNIGFSDEQQKSVDDTIASMCVTYGSEKKLEAELSNYGTNIASLKRYMVLWAKNNSLRQTIYAEGSSLEITDADVKQFFADNYNIADYIYISLTGGQKSTGEYIPLTAEELAQKKALANTVMTELNSGTINFDAAMDTYSEANYRDIYPNGYFIPNSGTAQGLDLEITNKIQAMSVDEIAMVETSKAIYIIKKHPMNAELYKTKEGFGESIKLALEDEDYIKQLETAAGVVVHDDVINAIDPAVIPSFNIDALMQ